MKSKEGKIEKIKYKLLSEEDCGYNSMGMSSIARVITYFNELASKLNEIIDILNLIKKYE